MPAPIYGYLGLLRHQGSVGSLYPVRSSDCMIGRDSSCSVRIHQVYISDQHCQIKSQNDKESTIKNLSINSCTRLNGADLEDTAGVLHHGDIITLGERNFVWEYPESSRFWNNPEKRYLKISPTVFLPKKTVSLPSKMIRLKVSNTRTNSVKAPLASSSTRSRSQFLSLKPGVSLKKASSQSKLQMSSSSGSGFKADWPVTPTHKGNLTRKKSRASSANFLPRTSKNAEVLSKTPELKNSAFKTLAPNMLASLQKQVSEMSLDDSEAKKFPHTIYGQLAILRPNGAFGSHLPLSTDECTIGRGLECGIRIALPTISDKQCLISSKKNQESTITNLSTFSSTLLNGKNLGKGTTKLCHGDVITMANRSFQWEYPKSSQFWEKTPDVNPNTKLTNQYDKKSPSSLGSKTQKPSVASGGRRVAAQSNSTFLKTLNVMTPEQSRRESRKKATKAFSTSKMPESTNTSNSLLAHLNPEQTSHISMKHASVLKTPPNEKGNVSKKSSPFPFLNLMPELSKTRANVASMSNARKVLSFNAPAPNPRTLVTGKTSEKRNLKLAARRPTPARLKKSQSAAAKFTPRPTSGLDSSSDETPSPPPPAEGAQRPTVTKISQSLFKGGYFSSNVETRPKDTVVVERPGVVERLVSTLLPSGRSPLDDEKNDLSNTAGLIDPIYY